MAIESIWKDHFSNLGDFDSVPYRIKVQNEVIYSGKAYRRPGQDHILSRINDICSDYLKNELPQTTGQVVFTPLPSPVSFVVEIYYSVTPGADPEWEDIDVIDFLNDWSYDSAFNPSTMGLSAPINGKIDARQLLLVSALSGLGSAKIYFKDGTSIVEYIAGATGSGSVTLDVSSWSNVQKVEIGGKTFEVVSDCREWVFLYSNAYGGWDSFLIEGNVAERDELSRHSIQTEYDNRVSRNRGERNFVNEIEKFYTLNTSWLKDDESSRMHHLLNSTDVYLYRISTGEILPVVLTGTTTEYKTYKGNGGKLVIYTIEAKVAHDRIRK